MKLGEYNIPAASNFIAENIDLIEDEKFDELFNRAYKCLLVPEVAYMLTKSNIEFLHTMVAVVTEQFKYCNDLESITIPPNIKNIGRDAFRYCKNLKQVNFAADSNVTNISTSAFADCPSLQSIYIPDSVEVIGDYAFFKDTSLTNVVLPAKLYKIGPATFYHCLNLTKIDLPKSLRYICEHAFEDTHLTDIEIPLTIQAVDDEAFANCKFLKNVTITDNDPRIFAKAFQDCLSLETITYKGSMWQFDDAYGNQSWYRKKCTQAKNEPKIICNDGIIDFNH